MYLMFYLIPLVEPGEPGGFGSAAASCSGRERESTGLLLIGEDSPPRVLPLGGKVKKLRSPMVESQTYPSFLLRSLSDPF